MIDQVCHIEQQGSVAVATLTKPELDAPQMQEVVVELMEAMRYSNAVHFVFDFKAVTFASSACIGAMVQFLQDVEHVRGRIALANCSSDVAFLFKVTRLDTVFRLFDDVEQAVAGVGKG